MDVRFFSLELSNRRSMRSRRLGFMFIIFMIKIGSFSMSLAFIVIFFFIFFRIDFFILLGAVVTMITVGYGGIYISEIFLFIYELFFLK